MMQLTRLALRDFRSYPDLVWHPAARIAVLTGPNGSGKTNLLEAVSLLIPGRGLRGARNSEFARQGGDGRWAVAGRIQRGAETDDLGTGTPPEGGRDRRAYRLNGAPPRNQAEIAARIAALWLTPSMERLFHEPASGRRRFLDRLVWTLDPQHARQVAAHDTAMAGRNRLLALQRGGTKADPAWLAGLEDSMARHAVAAAASRADLERRLNAALASGAAGAFPAARLDLMDPIAARLKDMSALDTEDWLRGALQASRARDSAAGGAAWGAHRADMDLADAATGRRAGLASTGQQKTLLIGVLLGHAALVTESRGAAPLLLLDEPLVHLDAGHRHALFAALHTLPAQILLTGTDDDVFTPLRGQAEFLLAGNGALRACYTEQRTLRN